MRCPIDKALMMAIEFEEVEVDFCPACRGIWLDAGEIDLLAEDTGSLRAFMAGALTKAAQSEAPRKCPLCRSTMAKAATAPPDPITYDACPQGEGLWFDGGELEAVLERGAGGGPGVERIVTFLRGLLAADGENV